MSFWSRKKSEPAPSNDARAKKSDAPPERHELALLRDLAGSTPPSVDAAVNAFRALRSSPDEARAIDLLVHIAAQYTLPEPLLVTAAAALVDRGEAAAALGLLAKASSSPALLMAADLHADRGAFAVALALAERVLLRDLDHPGARERHRRMRTALGLESEPKRPDEGSATVVTREPDAPFALLREVARGGAGAVYEADDRELHRRVALKVYHHPERDRLQLSHEARVAAELTGDGIVRIFDLDPDHGWIALEWAPLGSLRDHIRARDYATLVPIERWAIPLAAALARVHAAGWVHHDVKPANVLLQSPDRPLLADFGIARRAADPIRVGEVSGSLGYVSPERLTGRASDPKDDVFGFGRILEDVLDALDPDAIGPPLFASLTSRWRPIAVACVGPDLSRPLDGRVLLTRIRVESA